MMGVGGCGTVSSTTSDFEKYSSFLSVVVYTNYFVRVIYCGKEKYSFLETTKQSIALHQLSKPILCLLGPILVSIIALFETENNRTCNLEKGGDPTVALMLQGSLTCQF